MKGCGDPECAPCLLAELFTKLKDEGISPEDILDMTLGVLYQTIGRDMEMIIGTLDEDGGFEYVTKH